MSQLNDTIGTLYRLGLIPSPPYSAGPSFAQEQAAADQTLLLLKAPMTEYPTENSITYLLRYAPPLIAAKRQKDAVDLKLRQQEQALQNTRNEAARKSAQYVAEQKAILKAKQEAEAEFKKKEGREESELAQIGINGVERPVGGVYVPSNGAGTTGRPEPGNKKLIIIGAVLLAVAAVAFVLIRKFKTS